MKKAMMTAVWCLLLVASHIQAQDENLKMQFNFENVSGTSVDDPISGITARTMGAAKVVEMGRLHVLDLGNASGYLDMTSQAGTLFRGMDNYSVSVYYRVDNAASLSGNGYFLWAFATNSATTATAGKYSAYRLNAQRYATSTGGYNNEAGIEAGQASDKGRWMHVAYTEQNGTGRLYINGKQAGTRASMPKNSTNYGTAGVNYCWLGRAPFTGDNYLRQTLVADFRLYDTALTELQVAQLAAGTVALEEAMVSGGGDNSALLSAIGEAEELLADGGNYPEAAVVTLTDALTVARNVSRQDCSQTLFDQHTADLRAAIAAFKGAQGFVFDLSGLTDVYSTDRGFRHPGGLHTAADFERIRQQLASGNATVKAAYDKLKAAEYSQAGVQTWPVETIVRGGGVGENYINAARGATMAYQNALRWQIDGTEANARAAVRILIAWARTCKLVSGDSNWALAAGLYGYEFAQAAELVRDYEGWSRQEFDEFKQWMLTVWYPGNINFMRGRNGTWMNSGGQGGVRPGHYWSNWPLCNALALISIGILCDDVFIYNQGMSFMKYDQAGTFQANRTANPILNDGCTEFIGNLVVTTKESTLETGAYGRLGQMQESGRDTGHSSMALGLAVDICQVAWNQGDDLYSYMDNRMAAGIEFVAACTQNVKGLPWTNYKYVDCRTAWHNGWLMEGPAEPAEIRPYWATVIGHYEGVKGVKMPFAEKALQQMGIDAGGTGGASGGYDHLGYSVLTHTHDTQLCPEDQRPTLLTPLMEYDGKSYAHNELGGLRNTYVVQSSQCLPQGKTVTLRPQLPDGEEDTGQWQWNTGATTKDITVGTDRSYVYRVTYTNKNGIQSEQCFTLAAEGDCTPSPLRQAIFVGGEQAGTTEVTVFYGQKVTLDLSDAAGWWTEVRWDNGAKGQQLTLTVARERDVTAYVVSQGGRREVATFHIGLKFMEPRIVLNGTVMTRQTTVVCNKGDNVVLQPYVPVEMGPATCEWSNGATSPSLALPAVSTSGIYTVRMQVGDTVETVSYEVFVRDDDPSRIIPTGNYMMRHADTDTYLTCNGAQQRATFTTGTPDSPAENQVWHIEGSDNKRHAIGSAEGGLWLAVTGSTIPTQMKSFYFDGAAGLARYALHTGSASSASYWTATADGSLLMEKSTEIVDFPFELIALGQDDGISNVSSSTTPDALYDLQGRRITATPRRGLYIAGGKKMAVK